MEIITHYFLPLCLGIGLSAAVGFRVFLPFLVMGLLQRFHLYTLPEGFQWIATNAALLTFGIAAVLEVAAYFIPWLDHLLDTITTPLAMAGGTAMMGSSLISMDPLWQWSLAIIAGGGTAGIIKGSSSALRILSTATTGGLGNFIVAIAEFLGSLLLSLLSFLWPVIICFFTIGLLIWLLFRFGRKKTLRQPPVSP